MALNIHSQKGVSVLSATTMILLVSFFGTLLVKLGPVYVDHWYLKGIVQSVAQEPESSSFRLSDIRSAVQKRLTVNNVSFDVKEGLKLDTTKNPKLLVLDYQKQIHIMFNVDALVSFRQEYPLSP